MMGQEHTWRWKTGAGTIAIGTIQIGTVEIGTGEQGILMVQERATGTNRTAKNMYELTAAP